MPTRIAPLEYFGEEGGITNNYTPLIIGAICIVAIVALALAYMKK